MPFGSEIESITALLSPLSITWGFCGGWAIDLFLNHITRSHKDIDVAILRADQRIVFDFLRQKGWRLEKAVDGTLIPLKENELLTLPTHTVWCRNARSHPDFLEILLNESDGNQFLFRRNRLIHCPLNKAFLISLSGFPILAPEIVLLYKSNNLKDAGNRHDFQSALATLNAERRQWLAQALHTLSPDHEWLKDLTEPNTHIQGG